MPIHSVTQIATTASGRPGLNLARRCLLISALVIAAIGALSLRVGFGGSLIGVSLMVEGGTMVAYVGGDWHFPSPKGEKSAGVWKARGAAGAQLPYYVRHLHAPIIRATRTWNIETLLQSFERPSVHRPNVEIGMPLWTSMAVLITAIAILRNGNHPQRNVCRNCGYSLFGNQSGVCSECGTPYSPAEVKIKDVEDRSRIS